MGSWGIAAAPVNPIAKMATGRKDIVVVMLLKIYLEMWAGCEMSSFPVNRSMRARVLI